MPVRGKIVVDRKAYNACMRPYMVGSKPKEQRKYDFCVGAKLCSGKAATETEAGSLCALPNTKTQKTKAPAVKDLCANITSMQQWINGGGEEECRPCLLPPVIQWYREELSENGMTALASEIESAVQDGDPGMIAWTIDNIKAKVPESLRQRLREFDCHAQLHKEG